MNHLTKHRERDLALWVVVMLLCIAGTALLSKMAFDALEYEQRRISSELTELREFVTQPPPGCHIFEDGSMTCLDEHGGWHFEAP